MKNDNLKISLKKFAISKALCNFVNEIKKQIK